MFGRFVARVRGLGSAQPSTVDKKQAHADQLSIIVPPDSTSIEDAYVRDRELETGESRHALLKARMREDGHSPEPESASIESVTPEDPPYQWTPGEGPYQLTPDSKGDAARGDASTSVQSAALEESPYQLTPGESPYQLTPNTKGDGELAHQNAEAKPNEPATSREAALERARAKSAPPALEKGNAFERS